MKHLLILISILLLSSPLFGQETGVLYQYETSSGIQWKTFGDGKVQPKYKGEIRDFKPNGQGIITYTGNGTGSQQITHGLGGRADCIWIKRRDNTNNWAVFSRQQAKSILH